MSEIRQRRYNWDRPFSSAWLMNNLLVIAGSLISAVGYVLFIIPVSLVPGGLVGVGIIVNHLTGWPIGVLYLVLNLPLLALAVRVLGANFGARTVLSMVVMSAAIDLLRHWWGPLQVTDDILVSAVFGGVLIGFGAALVLQGQASAGGTVVIAQLMNRWTNAAVGRLVLWVDGLVVLTSFLVFRELELVPYAIIAIVAISRAIDATLTGMDSKKAVLVISEQHEKIRSFILEKLDRGGTTLSGHGLYRPDEERRVIFCALRRREMAALRKEIGRVDSDAFVTVLDTQEVLGHGFVRP